MGSLAALAVVLPVGLAWACVAPVSLTTSSPTVQPGGMVHIIGRETAPGAPIEIHLDAPTGPILTTVTGQPGGMTSKWEWDVPITTNRDMNSVVPKATIYVGTEPDPAPAPDPRAGTLDVGSGPSTGTLVLLGRVAAVGGLLLVGGLTVLAGSGRSKPTPEPQRIKA